jgi:RND family efflux transporter MFP subunit
MSESPARKPAVIRKRFPMGWLVLGLLGLAVAVFVMIRRNAPVSLAVTTPTVFKAGQRNPLVSASGYLVARHRATLSAKVPGRLDWLGVEEGSRVQKGQIIARLEAPDLQANRDQTAVNLEQAEADLVRGEALFKEGILDRASLEHLRTGKASLVAQLRFMDATLENMVLRAPFTGTVTQKLSEVGETVSPGTAGGANAINAVAVLADFDSLEVEVEVSENGITKLRKGMPVEVRVDALEADAGAKPLGGELREIYPTSNRQKAVVIVRVAFREKNPYLFPDMGAKVTFLGEPYPRDVLVLGREQIVRQKGQPFVWVMEQGRAALKPITLVAENPIGYEVTGLDQGATLLVLLSDTKLETGAKVKVKER